jgi:hypothetical protein
MKRPRHSRNIPYAINYNPHHNNQYYAELDMCIRGLKRMLNDVTKLHSPKSDTNIIIFDIDDTLFHSDKSIIEPIPEMINIFKKLRDRGYIVSLITARRERSRSETEQSLFNNGIVGYADLHFKPDRVPGEIRECHCYYKERARKIVEQRHKKSILLNIGDQHTDLTGEHYMIGWKMPHKSLSDCGHIGRSAAQTPL